MLFIENPSGDSGKRFFKPALIEGDVSCDFVVVKAPVGFDAQRVSRNVLCQVSAEAGLARLLDSGEEANRLIRKFAMRAGSMTDFVPLYNESQVPAGIYYAIKWAIRSLIPEYGMAVVEFYKLCRDKNHKVFGGGRTILTLERAGLMQNGIIATDVRDITLTLNGQGLRDRLLKEAGLTA